MVISNTWFVGYTRNRLYGILSPKVTYGSAFGGGGSGIGGIKSTMEIHEFCIVRSLKLCSFLGCKWGVPLVIGGGGGGGGQGPGRGGGGNLLVGAVLSQRLMVVILIDPINDTILYIDHFV